LKQRNIEDACAEVSADRSRRSPGDVSATCLTRSLHDRAAGGSGTGWLGVSVSIGFVGVSVGVVGVSVGSGVSVGVDVLSDGAGSAAGPEWYPGSRGW